MLHRTRLIVGAGWSLANKGPKPYGPMERPKNYVLAQQDQHKEQQAADLWRATMFDLTSHLPNLGPIGAPSVPSPSSSSSTTPLSISPQSETDLANFLRSYNEEAYLKPLSESERFNRLMNLLVTKLARERGRLGIGISIVAQHVPPNKRNVLCDIVQREVELKERSTQFYGEGAPNHPAATGRNDDHLRSSSSKKDKGVYGLKLSEPLPDILATPHDIAQWNRVLRAYFDIYSETFNLHEGHVLRFLPEFELSRYIRRRSNPVGNPDPLALVKGEVMLRAACAHCIDESVNPSGKYDDVFQPQKETLLDRRRVSSSNFQGRAGRTELNRKAQSMREKASDPYSRGLHLANTAIHILHKDGIAKTSCLNVPNKRKSLVELTADSLLERGVTSTEQLAIQIPRVVHCMERMVELDERVRFLAESHGQWSIHVLRMRI